MLRARTASNADHCNRVNILDHFSRTKNHCGFFHHHPYLSDTYRACLYTITRNLVAARVYATYFS
jgi:hypothetical protein